MIKVVSIISDPFLQHSGEWRGLAVSIEDCHSKGRLFKSPLVLFFSHEGMLSDVLLASRKTDKTGQDM